MYIQMIDSSKYYDLGGSRIIANDKINFDIEEGELVTICGYEFEFFF